MTDFEINLNNLLYTGEYKPSKPVWKEAKIKPPKGYKKGE